MTTTIRLSHIPRARHPFTLDGANYFIERSPAPGDRHEIDIPVNAPRLRDKWQVMIESCRVAVVGFSAPDGRSWTWTWLDAREAARVLDRAGIARAMGGEVVA